jgi:hypothetical protein
MITTFGYITKLTEKNIGFKNNTFFFFFFFFGGTKWGGEGRVCSNRIFLGQKFTISLFLKKSPKQHDQEMFMEIFLQKSPYFKQESYVLAKIFGGVGGGFLAFLF